MVQKSLEDQQKNPTFRLLLVMQAVGLHGPITLRDLCAQVPVPRTAIWRAISTLREFGWVRMRLSDNAYELTHQCDAELSNSHFAHEASALAAAELISMQKAGAKAVDAGMFVAPGSFILVESTRTDAELGVPVSLIDDSLALSVQAAIAPADLLHHLRAYKQFADPEEAELIRSGIHARAVMSLTKRQRDGHAPVPKFVQCGAEILFVSPVTG